ncbi:MAG: GspH/FimT family pseudopilin [Myxococcota bacterium]|jgi:prepilin-type N-terminal cleavage/methylation domain-containing protein|nr:GspH/FimT family pseudopilin [Myxococcota bacterium]
MVASKYQRGVSLIEVVIVSVIIGVMAAVATPALRNMRNDQALRNSARQVSDAMMLARTQAIRTGSNVIVVFQSASGSASPAGLTSTNIIDVINDGPATTADCTIGSTAEVVWSLPVDQVNNLSWGTSAGNAGNNIVPTDNGFAPTNNVQGSTFSDATVTSATIDANKFAHWIVFQPDGIPRLMTPADCANLGIEGQGGGGIYLTNGRRDYAIILSALGTTRVHHWSGAAWIQ